ncbi:conserved hypothetical Ustilaginaceae-specific protein [Sporisorium reilianum SRZ2]|uniref:Conserved hypothetical Ustilaginaceae-specific protein n=1 Tax=Sporisorium reilianum (strain SRZ2) TaxID=999809 RepID=E6ZSI3_SPORE|nr:conserved hypothetical Ustilaginaceae-specific protein [Sporisorium reilianum SRZ2]
MSEYVFSASDWPPMDESGRTIHYLSDVSKPPLERGVLLSSSRGKPVFPWQRLRHCFEDLESADILNLVQYYLRKEIEEAKRSTVAESLHTAFTLSFPDKIPATVKVFKDKSKAERGCYVSFKTPGSNVKASEIATMATFCDWSADGQPLNCPCYIGLETDEVLQPILFENVSSRRKDRFVSILPEYISEDFCPLQKIQLVDIWEEQTRSSENAAWAFHRTILVLVRVETARPDDNSLESIVSQWPGWLHFEDENLIRISYPGRFNFCKDCKHMAQDLEGANRRHLSEECIRIICGLCGHPGHDASDPEAPKIHKTACKEGQRKRQLDRKEKEEARKRQKAAHDAAIGSSTDPADACPANVEGGGTQGEQTQETSLAVEAIAEDRQRWDTVESSVVVKAEGSV